MARSCRLLQRSKVDRSLGHTGRAAIVAEASRALHTAPLMWKIVSELRDDLDLPSTFTLDACRHGGMTELEEAELTDGQGRALSGHRSKAYEGYAKRTMKRALAATRKRHAHRLAANASGTEILNEERAAIQNEGSG